MTRFTKYSPSQRLPYTLLGAWGWLLVVGLFGCSSAKSGPGGGGDIARFDMAGVRFSYCAVDESALATEYERLTPQERIGQHLMIGMGRRGSSPSPITREMIEEYGVGNVFGSYGDAIVTDKRKTLAFLHEVKRWVWERTGVPAFVALDQEGGTSTVLNRTTGCTDTMGNMPIGATRDPQIAFRQYDIMAREIRAMGFNMNFAPVLDTLYATTNGNLHTRPFSPDPHLNAELGKAAFAAMQARLVLPTMKHFPGDGITSGNTHVDHVRVEASREELERTVLVPFREAVRAGIDGAMIIPAQFTALDPERAAITSRRVITDVLRRDMGFEGLIVSDSLDMKGVWIGLKPGQVPGVESLKAGADLLLYVVYERQAMADIVAGIEAALASGDLPEAEFRASTLRILRMKRRYCLYDDPTGPKPDTHEAVAASVGRTEDDLQSKTDARQAITLVEAKPGVLPLSGKRVLYVGPGILYGDPGSGWVQYMADSLDVPMKARDSSVKSINYILPPDPVAEFPGIAEAAKTADVVVMGTLQAIYSMEQQQLLEWVLMRLDRPVIHVVLGVPFDARLSRGRAAAIVAAMNSRTPMHDATAAVLYGEATPGGTMLFDLSPTAGGHPGDADVEFDGHGEGGSNRCTEQSLDCSGRGVCVDTGAVFGCLCQQNWKPSADGFDCVPVGED